METTVLCPSQPDIGIFRYVAIFQFVPRLTRSHNAFIKHLILLSCFDDFFFRTEDETAFTKNKSPLGSIPVTSAQLSLISPDTYRRDHAFGVQPAGKSRTYVIIAEGEESLKQWLAALRKDGALMDDAAAEPQVPQTVSPFSQKEGFLWKMGAFVKSWHSRYFVLESEGLHYYKNKDLVSLPFIVLPSLAQIYVLSIFCHTN